MANKYAEFEEKEFETALSRQLQVSNRHAWSPGQALEHHVGFDYSAMCVDHYFWGIHGGPSRFSGFMLEDLFRRNIWERRVIRRPLPNFALNLFIQIKRPQIRARLARGFKACGIKAPHWRFDVDPHQQKTLDTLTQATAGMALVCYGSPAFDRVTQLYAHISAGTIIQNSTFPEAQTLTGHTGWNYDKPGASGVRNAEPESVNRPDLFTRIATLVEENSNSPFSAGGPNLKTLSTKVTACARDATQQVHRSVLFFQRQAEIEALMNNYDFGQYAEIITSFLTVLAFTDAFDLQWHVIGRGK